MIIKNQNLRRQFVAVLVGVLGASTASIELKDTSVAPVELSARDSGLDVIEPQTNPEMAMSVARAKGTRVEDLSSRTETTQVFANPEGNWTAEVASEPSRVLTATGTWQDVDATLINKGGRLQPRFATVDLSFSSGGDRTFAEVTEKGSTLKWQWPTELPDPVVEGPTATYKGAAPGGGDLVVTASESGFTHYLVLHKPPKSPLKISMPMSTDGAVVSRGKTGGINVRSAAGQRLISASEPLMWDSSEEDSGDPGHVRPVEMDFETISGRTQLSLSPNHGFLTDPTTVYPVFVDPAFTVQSTGDTWVQNWYYNGGQGTHPELRVGTHDGGTTRARSFLRFDSTVWQGKHVLAANMVLKNWFSASCSSAEIRAARVTAAWGFTTIAWNAQPSVTGEDVASYWPAHGATGGACPESDADWDLTDMTQDWADGAPNHGVRLAALNETNSGSWRKYRSANFSDTVVRPKLVVTYENLPTGIPAAPTAVTVKAASSPLVSAKLPGLSGSGARRMKVQARLGTAVVKTQFSRFVPPGNSTFVTLDDLPPGTYSIDVWADTGQSQSTSKVSVANVVVGNAGLADSTFEANYSPTPKKIDATQGATQWASFKASLPVGYVLVWESASRIRVVNASNTIVGAFVGVALDDAGNSIPVNLHLSAGEIHTEVLTTPSTTFPLVVGAIYDPVS